MKNGKIIDEFGGSSAVARICGVTVGAVSQWRNNGIPRPWLKYLQLLRPDLFEPQNASLEHEKAN